MDCKNPNWLEILPKIRGKYQENVSLSASTWLRVGGAAEVLFRPADLKDLILFLKEKPQDLPITFLGNGSNVLVRDGGIPGVVIRLGKGFHHFTYDPSTAQVDVGAGALDTTFARFCAQVGLGGLEFFCGIPGSIGGALRMNAGAYGKEVKDCLVETLVLDPAGTLHRLTPDKLGYSYRACLLPKDWLFVAARFRGTPLPPEKITQRMDELLAEREKTQPIREKTGGSTFKNPQGYKAWELIDQAGYRGFQRGGAEISSQHCNFMVNKGNATAQELEALGEEVRQKVLEKTGILLSWEIERMGVFPVIQKKGQPEL